MSYRRRLLVLPQKHSPDWKGDKSINDASGLAFDRLEKMIYDSAIAVARNPMTNGLTGRLMEIVKNVNGKTVTEFIGDPKKWMEPFMPSNKTFIQKFNTQDSRKG
jgi:hypothetical protein